MAKSTGKGLNGVTERCRRYLAFESTIFLKEDVLLLWVINERLNGAMLKGHSHAILVHFKNQKYVPTSMNAHKKWSTFVT